MKKIYVQISRKPSQKLTNAGVSGASMEPILPIMEEKANKLCLCFVGYSSAVYTYSDTPTAAIAIFAIR